jgi:hypothetical protein
LRDEETPHELTVEEELLAALLESNEALLEALRVYDDLERVAVEREAEEISRRDVRMDRRVGAYHQSKIVITELSSLLSATPIPGRIWRSTRAATISY